MQFFTDALVFVLTLYLALTNSLAEQISRLLPVVETTPITENSVQPNVEAKKLSTLNSAYEIGGSLPDILVKNAAYQQATVLESSQSTSESSTTVEEALVNIYCSYTTDKTIRTTTGTGFFINPAGVVMTNAHVAQFLLLETVNETGDTECILRGGDPAVPLYEVELLYISPAWVQKHADLITSDQPKGTGERDFALLYVTAGVDNRPMPSRFPYLALDTSLLSIKMMNATVVAAGYPAEGLSAAGQANDLTPKSATTTITDMFTFVSDYADVFSIAGSAVGRYGSSGGPILNSDGKVIGLISTKGSEEEGPNTLRALTISYIDRTITEESTFDLERTMQGQLAFRAKLFKETIVPFLSRVLESELE